MLIIKTAKNTRNSKGQAVALPMISLALGVVLAVGLLSFEVGRTAIAREQLKSATEAAALAGAATLAGSSSDDTLLSQQNAIEAATRVFRENDIFGERLLTASQSTPPIANQARLTFQLIDPATSQPVALGDSKGKAMEVIAEYGLPALAGKVIGLGNGPSVLSAKSSGGVGQMDVAMCFDCSTSMRFFTRGTRVSRKFDTATGKLAYTINTPSNGDPFIKAGGMTPQLLDGINSQLRGANDNSMPGNFPPGTAQTTSSSDVVCNLDENVVFTSFSEGGFDFPNVAALVEASRGNLENDAVFQSSGAATTLTGVVTPQAGYKAKYFELARKHTHPFAESVEAASNFFKLMNSNTDAHFGFVAFNQLAGQVATTTFQEELVASNYPAGGTRLFPLPAIDLNAALGQTNAQQVQTALDQTVPDGNTNIGGALNRAQAMFSAQTNRPNAKKAIILFTDGTPTVGNPSPEQACFTAANLCRQKGIAVFIIGLSLDASERSEQAQVCNQITGIAGNGGRFFQVTDASKLNAAFSSIARNLTQLNQ